jgi:hypothetical protein
MKILPTCLLLAAVLGAPPALALGDLAELRVIDRTTGETLPVYRSRGSWWIAGTPGHRYSIDIENRDGGRLLAITSVDGLNVLTGQTAAFGQTGYVFDRGSRYEITGWRKSDAEVASFEFTALSNAYATRTGRPANVGVLGVALFRERLPPPSDPVAPFAEERMKSRGASPYSDMAAQRAAGLASPRAESAAAAAAPSLGTAHGAREYSEVSHTTFERARATPDEVLALRYDSFEHLVELGVIPRRLPTPRAFPGSDGYGYVPDPPR